MSGQKPPISEIRQGFPPHSIVHREKRGLAATRSGGTPSTTAATYLYIGPQWDNLRRHAAFQGARIVLGLQWVSVTIQLELRFPAMGRNGCDPAFLIVVPDRRKQTTLMFARTRCRNRKSVARSFRRCISCKCILVKAGGTVNERRLIML